eukprot:5992940-Prorocentrum_lima.AAC.1
MFEGLMEMNTPITHAKASMLTGNTGAGKPPPPVLGKPANGVAPNNVGSGGKVAPAFFSVAGVANQYPPPPPPASSP